VGSNRDRGTRCGHSSWPRAFDWLHGGLGLELRTEAMLRSLTEEVVKSREIEGELLDRDQVRSSLARRLGVEIGAPIPADRHAAPAIHSPLLISVFPITPSTSGDVGDGSSGMSSNTSAPPSHAERRGSPTRSDTMKKEATQVTDEGANSLVPTTGVSVS
jgi:hypothetical protein